MAANISNSFLTAFTSTRTVQEGLKLALPPVQLGLRSLVHVFDHYFRLILIFRIFSNQLKEIGKIAFIHTSLPGAPSALCVEIGFTRTFARNQDVTVKLKSELIFIKFQYFFNVLVDPKPICFTHTFHQCVNHKKKLCLRYVLPTFGSFSFFQASL